MSGRDRQINQCGWEAPLTDDEGRARPPANVARTGRTQVTLDETEHV